MSTNYLEENNSENNQDANQNQRTINQYNSLGQLVSQTRLAPRSPVTGVDSVIYYQYDTYGSRVLAGYHQNGTYSEQNFSHSGLTLFNTNSHVNHSLDEDDELQLRRVPSSA